MITNALLDIIDNELTRGRASRSSLVNAPLSARAAETIGFRRGLAWVVNQAKRSRPTMADVSLPEALYRLRASGHLGLDVASALLVIHRFKAPQSEDLEVAHAD